MSTAAWNGVYFRTIVVCQNWRKQPHTSELISSFHGACTYGHVSLFVSVLSNLFAFTCARALNSYEGPRHHRGSVVQRSSVAPAEWGTRKSAGRKTTEEKTGRRYDLFVLIIIALIIARGARTHLVRGIHARTCTRAHMREARRGYTDNGAKERPLLGISRGTQVRLIRASQI